VAGDNPLEAGSSLGKIPIVGEILESIVQSFLGIKLFFLDREAWIEFIKKDRWAVRSSTLLFGMLTLTYFLRKILGQKTFSYSGHTYEIVNVIFFPNFCCLCRRYVEDIGLYRFFDNFGVCQCLCSCYWSSCFLVIPNSILLDWHRKYRIFNNANRISFYILGHLRPYLDT
jgi:hypothetical protein